MLCSAPYGHAPTPLAPAGLHARVLRRTRSTALAHQHIEAFAEERRRQAKRGQVGTHTHGLPMTLAAPALSDVWRRGPRASRSVACLAHQTYCLPVLSAGCAHDCQC